MSRPSVAAVVLTYNRWDLIRACLPTVLAQDWPDLEVCVVDNGSTDGTPAKLAAEFPGVKVLALPQNLGFAGANNAGVRACTAEYAAMISNDVLLPPEFMRRLVTELERRPDAALAGPAVDNLNLDMSQYPGVGTVGLTGTVIQNVFTDPTLGFGAAGCSLVFKRSALGLPFDADYGFFHEDVFLAWRARLLGYSVLRVPDVQVRHVGSATLGSPSGENRFLLERNRQINFLTFFSAWTRLRIRPLMCLARALEWAGDRRAGRSREPVVRARRWLRAHAEVIRAKRRTRQSERRVPDREIIRWMSCRITNAPGAAGRLANALAKVWCRLVGLRTWEIENGKRRAQRRKG